MTMTDSELKSKCFTILSEQVGNVEMERFIMLLNRDTFDYTEWRKNNLFQGETVDSLCDQIEQFQPDRAVSKKEQSVPDQKPTMA